MESALKAFNLAHTSLPSRKQNDAEEPKRKITRVATSILPSSDNFKLLFCVGCGMADYDTIEGMAHLIEHLFLVRISSHLTEKEGYLIHLEKDGSITNASTGTEHTFYKFDVPRRHLDGVLKTLREAVETPKWGPQDVEDEIVLMESEFRRKWTMDVWQLMRYFQCLAKRGHPLNKFGLGNYSTLKDEDLTSRTKTWMCEHYVPENMLIVVMGPESLQDMENRVIRTFSTLSSRQSHLSVPCTTVGYDFEDWNTTYASIPTVQDNQLVLSFLLRSAVGQSKGFKPITVLEYAFENMGSGSINASLMDEGFLVAPICLRCTNLDHFLATRFQTILVIKMNLTQRGMENVRRVISRIFEYLKYLLDLDMKKLRKWFTSFQQLQLDAFHFRSDDRITAPKSMDVVPSEFSISSEPWTVLETFAQRILPEGKQAMRYLLLETFVCREFDEVLLRETLDSLCNVANCNLLLASKSFTRPRTGTRYPNSFDYDFWEYGEQFLEEQLLLDCSKTYKFRLPSRGKSIHCPYKESLCSIRKKGKQCSPGLLESMDLTLVFSTDIPDYPMLRIFSAVFQHTAYRKADPDLSSSLFNLQVWGDRDLTVSLRLAGPSSSFPELFKKISSIIKYLPRKISPEEYDNLLSSMCQEHCSHALDTDRWISSLLKYSIMSKSSFGQDLLRRKEQMDHKAFRKFFGKLKKNCEMQFSLSGCHTKEDEKDIAAAVDSIGFEKVGTGLQPKRFLKRKVLQLPLGETFLLKKACNPLEAHNWVIQYYQVGIESDQDNRLDKVTEHLGSFAYCFWRLKHMISYDIEVVKEVRMQVAGLVVKASGLVYRHSAWDVENLLNQMMKEFYELLRDDPHLSERFFRKNFIPGESNCRKLSILVEGHDIVPENEKIKGSRPVRRNLSNNPNPTKVVYTCPTELRKTLQIHPGQKGVDDEDDEDDQ